MSNLDFEEPGHFGNMLDPDPSAPPAGAGDIPAPPARPVSPDLVSESWLLDDLYCDSALFCTDENGAEAIPEDRHSILAWTVGMLSASPAARRMLFEAAEQEWSLALEDLGGPDFHLDVPERLIVLDCGGLLLSALGRSEHFRHALLVSLIRALRDVWQEKRHGAFDDVYKAEDVLMLERARAADLDVMAVLAAWELRGEGLGGLWRYMIGAEEGDIALCFSGTLEREPASSFGGKALAAAFAQWFRDESRVRACDHETLDYLDSILPELQARRNGGYKKLGPVGVEVLSCLPDRTAYLQGRGGEILRDPLYAGMNDTINQTHLMQLLGDIEVVRVQDVPFRDAALAGRIFPGGRFTPDMGMAS